MCVCVASFVLNCDCTLLCTSAGPIPPGLKAVLCTYPAERVPNTPLGHEAARKRLYKRLFCLLWVSYYIAIELHESSTMTCAKIFSVIKYLGLSFPSTSPVWI